MRGLFSRVPRIWSLSALTFGIIQLHARSALGSLYPTKPISTTVFLAGQAAQLKWVEDGHAPVISELGHMKIQLFAGNITYIATIAHTVDPLSLSTTVYIPTITPTNFHVYTLRFIPSRTPRNPIYTAPFTIIPNPYLLASLHPPSPTIPTSSSISSDSARMDISTFSRITGTQPVTPNASGKYLPSQQQDSARSIINLGFGSGRSKEGGLIKMNDRMSVPGLDVDLEKMKFKLVFIIWPAMIGFSLAM